MQLYTLL